MDSLVLQRLMPFLVDLLVRDLAEQEKRDVNDPRNLLFREYLRVISEVRPKYVVMENVEGIRDLVFPSFHGILWTYIL